MTVDPQPNKTTKNHVLYLHN